MVVRKLFRGNIGLGSDLSQLRQSREAGLENLREIYSVGGCGSPGAATRRGLERQARIFGAPAFIAGASIHLCSIMAARMGRLSATGSQSRVNSCGLPWAKGAISIAQPRCKGSLMR